MNEETKDNSKFKVFHLPLEPDSSVWMLESEMGKKNKTKNKTLEI